jgi:predicted nucleic acid-binding protein
LIVVSDSTILIGLAKIGELNLLKKVFSKIKSAAIAGFDIMGLLGLLVLAKKLNLIDEIRPLIDKLKSKKFRISDKIIKETLTEAGEE